VEAYPYILQHLIGHQVSVYSLVRGSEDELWLVLIEWKANGMIYSPYKPTKNGCSSSLGKEDKNSSL
jgi:hypothetical protein